MGCAPSNPIQPEGKAEDVMALYSFQPRHERYQKSDLIAENSTKQHNRNLKSDLVSENSPKKLKGLNAERSPSEGTTATELTTVSHTEANMAPTPTDLPQSEGNFVSEVNKENELIDDACVVSVTDCSSVRLCTEPSAIIDSHSVSPGDSISETRESPGDSISETRESLEGGKPLETVEHRTEATENTVVEFCDTTNKAQSTVEAIVAASSECMEVKLEPSNETDDAPMHEHDVIREITFDRVDPLSDDDDNTTITNPPEIGEKSSSRYEKDSQSVNDSVDKGLSNKEQTSEGNVLKNPILESEAVQQEFSNEHKQEIDNQQREEPLDEVISCDRSVSDSSSKSSHESSFESDSDWDSVESSSGSEGDGLKRGLKRKSNNFSKKPQQTSTRVCAPAISATPRPYLMTQISNISFDSDDQEANLLTGSNHSGTKSDGSMDQRDLAPQKQNERPKAREVDTIEEAAPLPFQLSPKKVANTNNEDFIAERGVFEHLVEQLDASMSSMAALGIDEDDDDGEHKEPEKPGPPKSPGNTTHEKVYRQNFVGLTLSNEPKSTAQVSAKDEGADDDDTEEPDFFDDDIEYLNNMKVVPPMGHSGQSTTSFLSMDCSQDMDSILNELRLCSTPKKSEEQLKSDESNTNITESQQTKLTTDGEDDKTDPNASNMDAILKDEELFPTSPIRENQSPDPNASDMDPILSDEELFPTSPVRENQSPNKANVYIGQNIATKTPLNNRITQLPYPNSDEWMHKISLKNTTLGQNGNEDSRISKLDDNNIQIMDESSKSDVIVDEVTYKEMSELINLDPWEEDVELDEDSFVELIEKNPNCCQEKYTLEAFDAQMYPLSAICALGASLETVKKCYIAAPKVLEENHEFLGTPLHYACSFDAPYEVVKFLIKKNPNALNETDEFKRTPLHAAALFKADIEVVSLLLKESPHTALTKDEEHMTPLHLAIEAEDGVVCEVINKLLKSNQAACSERSLTDGVTPLMLAVARQCPYNVIKALIKADSDALSIVDKEGRIPLHVAAALKADAKITKLLIKSFPEGINVKDNSGDTPLDLARKVKLKKEIRALLQPLVV